MAMLADQFLQDHPESAPENSNWEEEDELLTQVLLDLEFQYLLVDHLAKTGRRSVESGLVTEKQCRNFRMVPDVISSCLRNFLRTGEIKVSTIFAARVLLDISGILQENSRHLHSTAAERG